MLRHSMVVVLGLYALGALAAVEGPGRTQSIRAHRAEGPVTVDGRLDEPGWQRAPVFTDFVQRFPTSGAAPSERTELRVLYDARTLYVGIIARDSQPSGVDRRLARRDSEPFSDTVALVVDPTHGHRTGYTFMLTAGGVQTDGLFYDDDTFTRDWDGVWDAAAGSVEDGWVAEFAIPLSQLRFPQAPVQTWGFGVRRLIARLNEELSSVENPRTSGATVSRLGHLTGLEGLDSGSGLELTPYLATRGLMRPRFSDASRAGPRLLDPTLDVGLDVRAALTSNLTLNATFNPDFGQLEADRLLLNLSTFEAFFPERRPFFTQGLELFQPPGAGGDGPPPQTLFYSRRIGLSTPILGAVKLTGTLAPGLEVGVVDALVTGPWAPQDEENPDRRLRIHASRPLRLGPDTALPGRPQPTTNFLTAVARGMVGQNARVGGTVASALPLGGTCTPEDAALAEDAQPVACLGQGGLAGAVDFDVRTADSAYGVLGQLGASRTVGGLPERTLPDGTLLRRGEAGYGGYVRAGRVGGEGLLWDGGLEFSTPTLELNATGFQRTQNEQASRVNLRYERPNGMGPFKALSARLSGGASWTTDGRGLPRDRWVNANLGVQLPSFDFVGLEAGAGGGGWDVRELRGSGVPLSRGTGSWFVAFGETNGNRPVSIGGFGVVGRHLRAGPTPARWGWGAGFNLALRPHPSLETRVEFNRDYTPFGPRYVEQLDEGRFLLGQLDSHMLSLTLRQQWVLSPRLTLQGYAQLFSAYGVYGGFYEGTSDAGRARIELDSLRPVERARGHDFSNVALNMSVVLRWEYRLGSTLFLVYSRSQEGRPLAPGEPPPTTVLPQGLWAGPAQDALLLKWSYYWSA